jgi:phosphoglycolate phosphatase
LKYKNILFDLDGTLIDSAPGIVESFSFAFNKIYGVECSKDIKSLIGPPINEVLFVVNGETDSTIIKEFLYAFKLHYDNDGFKKSQLFENVSEILKSLLNDKLELYIATNKRKKPTNLILDYLNLNQYFKGVYCPDSFELIFENKTKLVQNLLTSFTLEKSESLFVGDTSHDGIAAEANGLDFALVEYGYGNYENPTYTINNINKIVNILA